MRSRAIALAAVALALYGSASLASDDAETVPKPDVKVGDYWMYRVATTRQPEGVVSRIEVTFVGNDLILVRNDSVVLKQEAVREGDENYTAEWNPRAVVGGVTFIPHAGVFRFPLKVGDAHEATSINETTFGGRQFSSKQVWQVSVRGWEDVEVPAGRFRALKIEVDGQSGVTERGYYSTVKQAIWYVPAVKRWVKATLEAGSLLKVRTTSELIEHGVQ